MPEIVSVNPTSSNTNISLKVDSEEEDTFVEKEADPDLLDSTQKSLLQYFEDEGYDFDDSKASSFAAETEREEFTPIGKSDDLLGPNGFDLGIQSHQALLKKKRCYKYVTLVLISIGIFLCLGVLLAIFAYGFRLWQNISFTPRPRTKIETALDLETITTTLSPCTPVIDPVNIELSKTIMQKFKHTKHANCSSLKTDNATLQDGPFVFKIRFGLSTLRYRAHCDMSTFGGGWTVIQRRGNFENPEDFFHKGHQDYVQGFGDEEGEYWLGLDLIQKLTHWEDHDLLIQLWDDSGHIGYALYDKFKIGHGPHYRLEVENFAGNVNDSLSYSNNEPFSTFDSDQDRNEELNCAQVLTGGWWFRDCAQSNLNGLNRPLNETMDKVLHWGELGIFPSPNLTQVEMKIRPSGSSLKERNYHRYFAFEDNANILKS